MPNAITLNKEVFTAWRSMQVSLRIGLHDFSPGRTAIIQKLNQAGIPLVAWLLLPEEDGYWFNMHNGGKAEK